MNRSLISPRYFIMTLIVVIVLSRFLGLWTWQKRDHACLDNDGFTFTAKVQIFQWGALRLYTYPLIHDCPVIDQYSPETYTKKNNYIIPPQ